MHLTSPYVERLFLALASDFFVSLALASSLLSSTPPLLLTINQIVCFTAVVFETFVKQSSLCLTLRVYTSTLSQITYASPRISYVFRFAVTSKRNLPKFLLKCFSEAYLLHQKILREFPIIFAAEFPQIERFGKFLVETSGGFRGGMGGMHPPHQPESNDFGRKISLYFE